MLNKKLLSVAVASALSAGTAVAQDQPIVTGDELVEGFEISANVALTTDYRFRGISQSDEEPAVQGGFDAEFGPGFYIGTWGSTVDFDTNEAVDGSLELDYYAGWAGNIGDSDFGVDIGYYYYDYPGDDGSPEGDYQEIALGLSYSDLSFTIVYSDDYYAETDEFWYFAGDYSFNVAENWSIGLHAGYNMLEEDGGFLSSDEDGYWDYSVGVTWSVVGVDLSVAWVGTDLDDDDVFGTDWADDTVVGTISKSF
ncbi:MAG: TorF family putative porin [Pseudomonadota bacterium]